MVHRPQLASSAVPTRLGLLNVRLTVRGPSPDPPGQERLTYAIDSQRL
jgi:hypothetical protein